MSLRYFTLFIVDNVNNFVDNSKNRPKSTFFSVEKRGLRNVNLGFHIGSFLPKISMFPNRFFRDSST